MVEVHSSGRQLMWCLVYALEFKCCQNVQHQLLLYFCRVDWIVVNSFGAGVDGCIDVDFGDVAVDAIVCFAGDFFVLVVDVVGFDVVDAHCCCLVYIY